MKMENLPSNLLPTGSICKLVESNPKIRTLKNSVPIEQGLLYCFVLVGLSKDRYPVRLEKQVLIDFIFENYGGLVAEEIKIAFKMAVQHKFDIDVNHYQNFSAEYLGRVMKAYNDWRCIELKSKITQKEYTEPKIGKMEYLEQCLFKPFDRMKAGEKYTYSILDGWMLYDALWRLGIRFANESLEMREQIYAEAKLLTPIKKRSSPFEPEESKADHERRIIKTAKHLAFKMWVEDKFMEDVDLRKFIAPLIR